MKAERVWDYPRPPLVEPLHEIVRVVFAGRTIAETDGAQRVLETTHPPVYYLPRQAFTCEILPGRQRRSFCEWKGEAVYWALAVAGRRAEDCAWSYPDPTPEFASIRDHLAVYCAAMDACYVDGEKAEPQPGGFYGGWVTSNLIGPFKGVPGSMGW